ncbi:MAG: hypothetical protein M1546_24525 [Chloroflexi bacterium]|nr:hypothetical protein [Chloroflexota bacterium]
MSKWNVLRINVLGKSVQHFAGKEICAQVMEGSEQITDSTQPKRVAHWTKGAIERLEALADEETRCRIMQNCGHNCVLAGSLITKARVRRRKYATEEEYIEAMQQAPAPGTRLIRQGNVVYQFYTPRQFGEPPIRCYCGLVRRLPDHETMPRFYCECSRAFVEKLWSSVLDRPVEVELLESSVTGAQECKFAIHL